MTASRTITRSVFNLSLMAAVGISSQAVFASQWQTRIIGGEDVLASDPVATTTVALIGETVELGKKQVYLCTASIIADDTVVTAAHCVANALDDKVTLVFGTDLTTKGSTVVAAVHSNGIIYPKQYGTVRGRDQHDIAVVHFDGGLPDGFKPAEVLPAGTALTTGEGVLLAGYGISDALAETGDGVLRKTTVTLKDPAFGKTEVLLDQSQGHGACHGDSGGPAFVQVGSTSYLFGVTNRGYSDKPPAPKPVTAPGVAAPKGPAPDDCAEDAVYTRIDAYSKWIAKAATTLRARGPALQTLSDTDLDAPASIAAN
jgi:secreted trypsin-like serine protease